MGKRLAQPGTPTEADLEMLAAVLIAYDDCLAIVESQVRVVMLEFAAQEQLSLALTTRVKTTQTIREKLARSQNVGLKNMADIAGIRITGLDDRDQQDALAARLNSHFTEEGLPVHLVDRRSVPSSGYRALHVIVSMGRTRVEIQVRTQMQDVWAQLMEKLADEWGRGIRYGEQPEDADRVVGASGLTRSQFLLRLLDLSESTASIEEAHTSLRAAETELDEVEHLWNLELESLPDARAGDILGIVQQVRDRIEERKQDLAGHMRLQREALDELIQALEGPPA